MIPVEGHKGLYRDENSNAIINCNENDFNDYMSLKSKKILEIREVEELKKEIEELKLLLKQSLSNKI